MIDPQESLDYLQSANRILNAGVQQGKLHTILEAAGQELGARLTVADRLLGPLEIYTGQPQHDATWEDLAGNGLVPSLQWMSDLARYSPEFFGNGCRFHPWRDDDHTGSKPNYLVELSRHGKEFGYLSVVGGTDCPWRRELMVVLAGVLSLELESKGGHEAVNSVFEHYMFLLIENRFNSDDLAHELTEDTGLSPEGVYTLVLVDISHYNVRKRSLHAFRIALERSLYVTRSTIYKDRIVLLLSAPSLEAAIERDYSQLIRQLESADAYASVSRPFTTLWSVSDNYAGANKILQRSFCAPEGTRLLSADNMGISFVVDALLRIEKPRDLIDPRVRKLVAYDAANRTAYTETLMTYLRYSRKPAIVCSVLHIHRNTLDYRLQKIVDLVGIDWGDGDLCFRIYLSLNVLRFCRLQGEQIPLSDLM